MARCGAAGYGVVAVTATVAGGVGTWSPTTWLGAPAPGGLALPSARPTAAHLYAPRGVWLDDEVLVVADSGNHRVLVWHGVPTDDEAPADVVLGQPDFTSEGPSAGGRGPERGLHLPCGVAVVEGNLVVADSWHHRVLVWEGVPDRSDVAAAVVIGQDDLTSVSENAGGACGPTTLYWPYGVAWIDGMFWIADTGNRRVLGWEGLPEGPRPPAVTLGQPDASSRDENRGAAAGPDSFRWPHDVAALEGRFYVADAGDHRVLVWPGTPRDDRPASWALGQPDLVTAREFPYAPQSAGSLRFPYAVAADADCLAVADTANNRILVWNGAPAADGAPADQVLGQPDMTANGENRWDLVGRDTLCWPYGICLARGRLAVADSGNNRVMIWERR